MKARFDENYMPVLFLAFYRRFFRVSIASHAEESYQQLSLNLIYLTIFCLFPSNYMNTIWYCINIVSFIVFFDLIEFAQNPYEVKNSSLYLIIDKSYDFWEIGFYDDDNFDKLYIFKKIIIKVVEITVFSNDVRLEAPIKNYASRWYLVIFNKLSGVCSFK